RSWRQAARAGPRSGRARARPDALRRDPLARRSVLRSRRVRDPLARRRRADRDRRDLALVLRPAARAAPGAADRRSRAAAAGRARGGPRMPLQPGSAEERHLSPEQQHEPDVIPKRPIRIAAIVLGVILVLGYVVPTTLEVSLLDRAAR